MVKAISRHKKLITLVLACSLVAVPFLSAIHTSVIISYTDFFILNTKKIPDLFYSWQTLTLGQTNVNNLWGLFPLDAFFYLFNYLFHISPHITYALFIVLINIGGFLAFYFFINEAFSKVTTSAKILGGFFFIFNIYNQLNISSSFAFSIPYYVIPLQLLLLLKGLRTKKYLYYGILLALVNAATFGINLAFAAIAVGVIVIFGIWEVFNNDGVDWKDLLRLLAPTGIITLLLVSWWLAPMTYGNMVDSKTTSYVLNSEKFDDIGTTILQVFRNLGDWSFFSGYKGVPYHNYAYLYSDNPLIVLTSFLIPILVLVSFIYFRDKSNTSANLIKKLSIYYILCFFTLMFIGGTNNDWPTHTVAQWIFNNVPFSMIFRSTYKFTEVVTFSYAVVLTIFVNDLFRRSRSNNRPTLISFLIAGIFLAILFSNTYPTWTNRLYESKNIISSIPTDWQQMADYVNTNLTSNNTRTLLLPDQYFPVYDWGGSTKALPSEISDITFNTPVVHDMCNGCASYYTSNLLHFIYDNLGSNNLDKFLGNIDITNILQRNDFDYSYYNSQSPIEIKRILKSHKSIQPKKTIGKLNLYAINPALISGRIYSPGRVIDVENLNGALGSYNDFNTNNAKNSFILSNQLAPNDTITPVLENEYYQLFRQGASTIIGNTIVQNFNVNGGSTFKFSNKTGDPKTGLPYVTRINNNHAIGNPSNVKLAKGNYSFKMPIHIDNSNLLDDGSFQDGLWQDKVGDCQDQTPNALLSMSIIKDGDKHNNAALLTANTDIACIQSPKIEVMNNPTDYDLSFDYKVLAGGVASYCVWDGNSCISSQTLTPQNQIEWHTIDIPFSLNSDSKYISIYLYAPATNGVMSSVEYSNVSIKSIAGNILGSYTFLPTKEKDIAPIKLTYKSSNPSKYEISATIKKTGLLVFQESFSPGWRAFITPGSNDKLPLWRYLLFGHNGYAIPAKDHIISNSFANGWWITPSSLPNKFKSQDGHYQIVLEYWPQRYLVDGVIVSTASLTGCLIFLGLSYHRRTHKSKAHKYETHKLKSKADL